MKKRYSLSLNVDKLLLVRHSPTLHYLHKTSTLWTPSSLNERALARYCKLHPKLIGNSVHRQTSQVPFFPVAPELRACGNEAHQLVRTSDFPLTLNFIILYTAMPIVI